ncbi:hypothetical protein B0A48_08035 [Cryoendolithus antarcticus]|uniref:Uncharacterized protein n=1 Tax=Cryoendolithus antarcticus TaxID=1507870 RepID=A0A1V8T0R5_9PEZI|nr:hypothetical protein B0A48_08035 [Cryoendolithus antarcticus]
MGKALWIRSKLSNSIPWQLRPYFHLIADPAAGTVTVVARTPALQLPGLWQSYEQTLSPPAKPPWSWHLELASLGSLFGKAVEILPSTETSDNSAPSMGLLHRPWMDAVRNGGFVLEPAVTKRLLLSRRIDREEQSAGDVETAIDLAPEGLAISGRPRLKRSATSRWRRSKRPPEDQRFTVDIDFAIRDQVIPVQMTWQQFVWFALGSGASPYDPNLLEDHGECRSLEQRGSKRLLTITTNADRKYVQLASSPRSTRSELKYDRFSLARALAWDHVMILPEQRAQPAHKHNVSVLYCYSVGQTHGVSLYDCSIEAESYNDTRTFSATQASNWSTCLSMSTPTKASSHIVQPLTAALAWWFYDQEAMRTPGLQMPVTDRLQMVRQQSLHHLKQLDSGDLLEPRISALWQCVLPQTREKPVPRVHTDEKVGSVAGTTLATLPVNDTIKKPANVAVSDATVPSPDARKDPQQHEVTENGHNVPDATGLAAPSDPPLHVARTADAAADKRPSAILRRLRTDFAASVSMHESTELAGLIAVIHHKLKEVFARSQKRVVGVGPSELDKHYASDIEKYQRLLIGIKNTSLPPRLLDERARTSSKGMTARTALSRDEPILDCLNSLREKLQRSCLPGTKQPELTLDDESADHTLLAHIPLCFADWEKCPRQAWPVREDVAKLIDELIKALDIWTVHQKYKKEQLAKEYARLTELLKTGMKVAEEGIYTAPDSGLRELLRAYDGNVYLL